MRGEDLCIQGRQRTRHANLVVFGLQDALVVGLKQLREMLFQVLIVLFPLFHQSLEVFLAHLKKSEEEIHYWPSTSSPWVEFVDLFDQALLIMRVYHTAAHRDHEILVS